MGLLTLLDSLAHRVRGWKRRELTLGARRSALSLAARDLAIGLPDMVRPLSLGARRSALSLERRRTNLNTDTRMI